MAPVSGGGRGSWRLFPKEANVNHVPLWEEGGHSILREHLLDLAAVKIPLEHSPELLVSERGGGN